MKNCFCIALLSCLSQSTLCQSPPTTQAQKQLQKPDQPKKQLNTNQSQPDLSFDFLFGQLSGDEESYAHAACATWKDISSSPNPQLRALGEQLRVALTTYLSQLPTNGPTTKQSILNDLRTNMSTLMDCLAQGISVEKCQKFQVQSANQNNEINEAINAFAFFIGLVRLYDVCGHTGFIGLLDQCIENIDKSNISADIQGELKSTMSALRLLVTNNPGFAGKSLHLLSHSLRVGFSFDKTRELLNTLKLDLQAIKTNSLETQLLIPELLSIIGILLDLYETHLKRLRANTK